MGTSSSRLHHITACALVLILFLAGCELNKGTSEEHVFEEGASEELLSRIAFGSCADEKAPQPIWNAILAEDPQLFIFAGDNVYGDTYDMDTLRAAYQDLAQRPGFQQLRRQVPILATWDDHDYGADGAGYWYPKKEASEEVFADFFNVPADSPRRQHPGIYGAKMFGPPGKRVQVILLDTRYFRSRFGRNDWSEKKHERGFGPYAPNTDPEATMLGQAQWEWLGEQLEKPAEVRLIVSSIQVVSSEHGWEVWAQLPHERERLFSLIEEKQANGVIFLSGDVHWAEISRYDEGPYPLYDVTSSALNQTWLDALNLPNSRRVGSKVYPYPNFGMIEIDWSRSDPLIQFRILDEEGGTAIRHQVHLSELQA